MKPDHPGKTLAIQMAHRGVTQAQLSRALGVTEGALCVILKCRKPLGALMAHRLARAFGTDPWFWAELQARWDVANTKCPAGVRVLKSGGG